MNVPTRRASPDEVPVLDLAPLTEGSNIRALAKELDQACQKTGFFYVKNHGISEITLNAVFGATRRYFAIPEENRAGHEIEPVMRRGWMRQGINQHPGHKPDLKESYDLGWDLPMTDPAVMDKLPLHGPNKWPEEMPWLKEVAEAYYEEVTALGFRLIRLIAVALGLNETYFLDFTNKPMIQMRMFHYPPQPPMEAEDVFGVAPHTDYGMITLLAQDPIGGLELQKRDGEWVAAPYIDGTLVVNIGDLLQRWTNDRYISNAHRVINETGRERYSIPVFFNLDYFTPVKCLPTCSGLGNPKKYAPITSGDYILERFREVQKYRT